MLNKEEKRLVETYILPLIDRALNVCDNDPDEIYGEKYLFSSFFDEEEVKNGKKGLFVAFCRIRDDLYEAKKIIKIILDKKYVESMTWEQKEKIIEQKYQKEEKLRQLEEKNREKLLKKHKKQVIAEFIEEKQPKFENIIRKKELNSYSEGIKNSRMSEQMILNKAEYIKLKKELSGESE